MQRSTIDVLHKSNSCSSVVDGLEVIARQVLGMFLAREVSGDVAFFRKWFFDPKYTCIDGNTIELDKEKGYIFLRDTYSQEKVRTILKIPNQRFLKLLDDWEEKVVKLKPQEVIIKFENDEFIIETKN